MKRFALLIAVLAIAGVVNAAHRVEPGAINPVTSNVYVDADNNIIENVIWTKDMSPINLVGDIYVAPGVSLTIEAGTVIASYYDDLGSLAVTQGADIHVMGTQCEPVIMTSAEDVATWDGSVVTRGGSLLPDGNTAVTSIDVMGNPKSGTWRAVCNEWGSLAIMGYGYISGSHYADVASVWTDAGGNPHTNTKCPSADNKKEMEGLVNASGTDQRLLYGGNDDEDNSGEIHYLSLRYGGRDTEENKELNGLSLGAIGRGTDIDHVEVMNNVDDGIELWGGAVRLDHITIWNIGDDSLDFDEGWRGCAQYGLIVQGYCREAKQGSGIGDNAFEHDGAEDSDAQPMTTVKISKFTVVGQPASFDEDFGDGSDGGAAFRDNARVQYDSCMWIDLDDQLILFDNADGDGAQGYDGTASNKNSGAKNRYTTDDSTLTWVDHWTTSYTDWVAGPNSLVPEAGCTVDYVSLYENVICSGYDITAPLCNITNSVTFGENIKYGEYDQLVLDGADLSGNDLDVASLPIQSLVRGADVNLSIDKDYGLRPVTFINPNPVSGITAGGFSGCNWLACWTAADAYGMTDTSMNVGPGSADLNCDGSVNMEDLSLLSGQWLN